MSKMSNLQNAWQDVPLVVLRDSRLEIAKIFQICQDFKAVTLNKATILDKHFLSKMKQTWSTKNFCLFVEKYISWSKSNIQIQFYFPNQTKRDTWVSRDTKE